ncbi:MAG: hypothetical protein JKY42_05390, partial [Flavobacteriales bacterium]|nr:hypothetical protein [Flavobacteriales bacterium]
MRLVFFLLLIAAYFTCQAQYKPKEYYKYDWDEFKITEYPEEEEGLEEFNHYIVDENVKYIVTDAAGGDYVITLYKQLRIKYNKTPTLSTYSIMLPETFDPIFDFRGIPEKQKYRRYGPTYYNHKIKLFASRIIKTQGDTINGIQRLITRNETGYKNKLPLRLDWYQYDISTIQAGDIVDIVYTIEIPYFENPEEFNCQRIFFNSNTYKKKSSWYLSFPTKAKPTIGLVNGIISSKQSSDKKRIRYWFDLENLHPNINEINSRPHLNLPHLVLNVCQDGAWIATRSYGGIAGYLPYWVSAVAKNRNSWHPREKSDLNTKLDKQNKLVDNFVFNSTDHIPDSLPLVKLFYLHNVITDSFDYQNDWAHYAGWDQTLQNVGTNVTERNLRQISRFRLYHKIFYRLEIPYYTTYLLDSRVGAIDDQYMSPINDNERCYSIPTNNRLIQLYPKKSRFGYAIDEIPFYWENSTQLLIYFNQNISPENIGRTVFTQMPGSNEKENYRQANTLCKVSTSTNEINFETKLTLSGQFSTMTRGVYQYSHVDSSINRLYRKKIYELGNNTSLDSLKLKSKSDQYPFKANFNLWFNSSTESNSIDLSNWFQHIIEPRYSSTNRSLPFYYDFLFTDSFRYFLKFDNPIELIDYPENITIESVAGIYSFHIKQMDSTSVMISSNFTVKNQKIIPANSTELEQIFESIKKLNQS